MNLIKKVIIEKEWKGQSRCCIFIARLDKAVSIDKLKKVFSDKKIFILDIDVDVLGVAKILVSG